VLILPAEAADSRLPRRFEERYFSLALNQTIALAGLVLGDGHQCVVIDGLDESVAQRVEHGPQSADVFGFRDMLLYLWADGSVINDGATRNHVCQRRRRR
jgi:hypothetical protein